MRLVLEKDEPFLGYRSVAVIHFHRNDNRTGIDLVRLLHIFQFPVLFQLSHRHQRQIHQTDKLVRSARKNFFPRFQIVFVCFLNRFPVAAVPEIHLRKLRRKCRMTTVVGPVSVQYPDFRHRWIPVFFSAEIVPDMKKIPIGHRQSQRII